METWLEVLQWKDSSFRMLTAAHCLEDILALQVKKKRKNQRKERNWKYNFTNIEHFSFGV